MILITGGAGYIGSHCVLEFIKDHNVVVFDNFLTGNIETIEVLKNISSNIEFFEGDLKNIHDIKRVFEKYNFEAVIHFAGLSSVEDSFLEEKKYFENNVLGTKNLLDVMIQQNVLKFIFSSSAAIFGEPKYLPIDEKHPENPINPYGKTKLEIEKLLKEYDKKYNLICAVRIWALLQGMEVTTIDEIDLALKKDDSIYGFIIEPDRTEQELKTLVKDAFSKCNYVYVVTDDNAKRRKLVNIITNHRK